MNNIPWGLLVVSYSIMQKFYNLDNAGTNLKSARTYAININNSKTTKGFIESDKQAIIHFLYI